MFVEYNRETWADLMEYIKRKKIKTPKDAMVVNYWWNTIARPWEVGFIGKKNSQTICTRLQGVCKCLL
jgi:hypothetical protein